METSPFWLSLVPRPFPGGGGGGGGGGRNGLDTRLVLALILYGISTEISQISRMISGYQRRFHGFHERFQISREISGNLVYEISVSGGPLGTSSVR